MQVESNDIVEIRSLFSDIEKEIEMYEQEKKDKIQQQLIIEYRSVLKDIFKDQTIESLTVNEGENEIIQRICQIVKKWKKKPGNIPELRFKAIKLSQELGLKITTATRNHRETLLKWYQLYWDENIPFLDKVEKTDE